SLLRVDRVHPAPGFVQFDERVGEWDERLRFGKLLCLNLNLPQLVTEVIFEKQVISAAVLIEPVEIEFGESAEPLVVKLLHPGLPRRRDRDGVEADQAAVVGGETFDERTQFAVRQVRV